MDIASGWERSDVGEGTDVLCKKDVDPSGPAPHTRGVCNGPVVPPRCLLGHESVQFRSEHVEEHAFSREFRERLRLVSRHASVDEDVRPQADALPEPPPDHQTLDPAHRHHHGKRRTAYGRYEAGGFGQDEDLITGVQQPTGYGVRTAVD